MEPAEIADRLTQWLRDEIEAAGAGGAVVGLSGGIDSAVTAALCKRAFPGKTVAFALACHSHPRDAEDAGKVAETFDIPLAHIVLDDIYDGLLGTLDAALGQKLPQPPDGGERLRLAAANIKPRLRMSVLYYYANRYGYLVAGTGNRVELEVGYFTKYGDGGVDLEPLGNLLKSEVYALGEYLGVPQSVLQRPPSAGLWQGQTDEEEMGITYEQLDHYLSGGETPPDLVDKIEAMRAGSAHKRAMPRVPEDG